MSTVADSMRLTSEQVVRYHDEGWLGPFRLCGSDEMADFRAHVERDLLGTPHPLQANQHTTRYLDSLALRRLLRRAELTERATAIFGDDLMVWNSYFWNKQPGGKEVPWHQDIAFWPLEPQLTLTAWVALDRIDRDNSCVQIIPGSHRELLPHRPAGADQWLSGEADPASFDRSAAIDVELEPGEFFFFNERLLHHSERNRSQRRRLGMSVRMAPPFVRIRHDEAPLYPGHRALLIAGRDRFGLNRYAD